MPLSMQSFAVSNEIIDIVSGYSHNCVLYATPREMRCWGLNMFGQLGYGDTNNRGDEVGEMRESLPTVVVSDDSSDVIDKLSLGNHFTCVLFTNGRVKCFGDNSQGQLGQGDKLNRGYLANQMGNNLPFIDFGNERKVLKFSSGNNFNCAYLDDMSLVCFGGNNLGQVGIGLFNRDIGDNADEMGKNLIPVDIGKGLEIQSVHIGSTSLHACVIIKDYKLKCWGANWTGQLGLGDKNNRGLKPEDMGDNLPFVDLGKRSRVVNLFLGNDHTCAILDNSAMVCWGYNGNGQLGIGKRKSVGMKVKSMGKGMKSTIWGKKVSPISAVISGRYTCGLLDNGTVKCYGENNLGQLGQGDVVMRGTTKATVGKKVKPIDLGNVPDITKVVGGYEYICILFSNSKIKCYGNNESGQLGLEDTKVRGDEVGEMGNNLPYIYL